MDGDLNTFSMRVNVWYNRHFPEPRIIVKENYMFVRRDTLIQEKHLIFLLTISHDDEQEI